MDGAEVHYKRAIEADPKHANNLGNYGQFLVGLARLPEGRKALISAFERFDRPSASKHSRVCFSLWLVSRMQEHAAERWERDFKFLIQKGFSGTRGALTGCSIRRKVTLPTEEFEYAEGIDGLGPSLTKAKWQTSITTSGGAHWSR